MEARVSLRNVRKVFDDGTGKPLVAIDGISLEAARGEFLAIVGPSGCGKSTLLKIIAGLLESTAGVVEEDGRRVSGPPKRFVYLFQQYSRSCLHGARCSPMSRSRSNRQGKQAAPTSASRPPAICSTVPS